MLFLQQVHQSKRQMCHLNHENTPTKTPSAPSQSKEYAIVNFSPQYWFTLFCHEAINVANLRTFSSVHFEVLKIALAYKNWQLQVCVFWIFCILTIVFGDFSVFWLFLFCKMYFVDLPHCYFWCLASRQYELSPSIAFTTVGSAQPASQTSQMKDQHIFTPL